MAILFVNRQLFNSSQFRPSRGTLPGRVERHRIPVLPAMDDASSTTDSMVPLVYHPLYNITAFGLERLHPFDGRKYRRIHDALVARGLRRARDFVRPRPITVGCWVG